jgi:hypothetical protein
MVRLGLMGLMDGIDGIAGWDRWLGIGRDMKEDGRDSFIDTSERTTCTPTNLPENREKKKPAELEPKTRSRYIPWIIRFLQSNTPCQLKKQQDLQAKQERRYFSY